MIYFFQALAAAAWLTLLIPHAGFCGGARESLNQVPARSPKGILARAYNVDFDDDERRGRMLAAARQGLLTHRLPVGTPCLASTNNHAHLKLFCFDVVLLI